MKRSISLQNIGSVEDVLMFGKYKGNKFKTILSDDAQYLEWAMNENIISVSEQIKDMIYDCLTY